MQYICSVNGGAVGVQGGEIACREWVLIRGIEGLEVKGRFIG